MQYKFSVDISGMVEADNVKAARKIVEECIVPNLEDIKDAITIMHITEREWVERDKINPVL